MYLLVDECCGKAAVRAAEDLGHTAQRTIDVGALGKGASDSEIYDFACRHSAAIVTANLRDFEALAIKGPHPGMIFVPQVLGSELARLIRIALPVAEAAFAVATSRIVEVTEDGCVTSFTV